MPSEHQLAKAEKEVADLEQELKTLEEGTEPKEAAQAIMDYISNNHEVLTDFPDEGCCVIL